MHEFTIIITPMESYLRPMLTVLPPRTQDRQRNFEMSLPLRITLVLPKANNQFYPFWSHMHLCLPFSSLKI
jgi:hypothetical protein